VCGQATAGHARARTCMARAGSVLLPARRRNPGSFQRRSWGEPVEREGPGGRREGRQVPRRRSPRGAPFKNTLRRARGAVNTGGHLEGAGCGAGSRCSGAIGPRRPRSRGWGRSDPPRVFASARASSSTSPRGPPAPPAEAGASGAGCSSSGPGTARPRGRRTPTGPRRHLGRLHGSPPGGRRVGL
jgi:hypothetical protein